MPELAVADETAAHTTAADTAATVEPAGAADQPLVEADLLVEDVSIDGMCGVY